MTISSFKLFNNSELLQKCIDFKGKYLCENPVNLNVCFLIYFISENPESLYIHPLRRIGMKIRCQYDYDSISSSADAFSGDIQFYQDGQEV